MTSLPDGADVRQSDVIRWAQEQAVFLRPPSLHHVLLYLCCNAFYSAKNPEGMSPGNVLSGRTRLRTISRYTGLGMSTVRAALRGLQDQGFIVMQMCRDGKETNGIYVAWGEDMDARREEFRQGRRPLPKMFERAPTVSEKPKIEPVKDNVVPLHPLQNS